MIGFCLFVLSYFVLIVVWVSGDSLRNLIVNLATASCSSGWPDPSVQLAGGPDPDVLDSAVIERHRAKAFQPPIGLTRL
jgi:hypothetical protein